MPMRVICEKCGSNYTLPDERLTPGRRVQFTCRHCQHRIVVEIGGTAVAPASAVAAAPSPERASAPLRAAADSAGPSRMATAQQGSAPSPLGIVWFVAIDDDHQERMTSQNLRQGIADGAVTADTLVWRKGYSQWTAAAEAPEWAAAFRSAAMPALRSSPPPVPPPEPLHEGPGPTLASPLVAKRPTGQVEQPSEAELRASGESMPIVSVRTPDNGMQIAGMASVWRASPINTNHAAQKAVALPIIRMASARSQPIAATTPMPGQRPGGLVRRTDPPQPASPAAPVHRESPAPVPSEETQMNDLVPPPDRKESAGESSWAPSTDTYTGPKGKLTRKIDDHQRQALIQSVERQEFQQRLEILQTETRSWQRLAMGLLVAFIVVLMLAVWAAVRWTATENDLKSCSATLSSQRTPAAATSPPAH
jgi:hypothetical protein